MLRKMIETPENPYHLSWDITSACDLHCSFCYNQKKENEEVSKNLIDLILNQIIELAPLHLGIGGGEPTKSKYEGKCSLKSGRTCLDNGVHFILRGMVHFLVEGMNNS
ncbi:MAG: hypothetical protein MSC43_06225 [Clostridiales bacterium]|nr:hypothetical protein [Clostridiales bacterium]MDD7432946.1 hypothetical protein [Clostridiales bacterium]MDY3062307.1 hypothetical protein [Eubacteriales bacterium]